MAPWTLLDHPDGWWWQTWAHTAEAAEAEAQEMIQKQQQQAAKRKR